MAAVPTPTTGGNNNGSNGTALQGVDLFGVLKQQFAVGPANWDFFKDKQDDAAAAAAAGAAKSTPRVPPSGAHVTLQDLARDPKTIRPIDYGHGGISLSEAGSDDYIGVPDPSIYGPNTTYLPPDALQKEIEKGNIMKLKDFNAAIAELDTEDRAEIGREVAKRYKQEQLFVALDNGKKVSVWDLEQYLFHNPELDALEASRRAIPSLDPTNPDPSAAGRLDPDGSDVPFEVRHGGESEVMASPQEIQELEMDWGQVAAGSVWKRRPTRWLRGVDGVKDWDVMVFGHEIMGNMVLGAKYGRQQASQVLSSSDYKEDVLRVGPMLGMTFVLEAARDMPLREVASSWSDRLRHYLQRQAPLQVPARLRSTGMDPLDMAADQWPHALQAALRPLEPQQQERLQGLGAQPADDMGICWRRMGEEEHRQAVEQGMQAAQALPSALGGLSEALAEGKVLNPEGTHWLKGSQLWVTLAAEGEVLLQAQSAGLLKERHGYELGRVHNEALSGAVMAMMLGPAPLDPRMAEQARQGLLLHANGFTTGNTNLDPNHPDGLPGGPPRLPRIPANPRSFRLGRVGSPHTGTLINGIGEERVLRAVEQLVEDATAAAAVAREAALAQQQQQPEAVADAGATASKDHQQQEEEAQQAASAAAQRVLRQGLARLGPGAARFVRQRMAYAGMLGAGAEEAGEDVSVPMARELFSLAHTMAAGK